MSRTRGKYLFVLSSFFLARLTVIYCIPLPILPSNHSPPSPNHTRYHYPRFHVQNVIQPHHSLFPNPHQPTAFSLPQIRHIPNTFHCGSMKHILRPQQARRSHEPVHRPHIADAAPDMADGISRHGSADVASSPPQTTASFSGARLTTPGDGGARTGSASVAGAERCIRKGNGSLGRWKERGVKGLEGSRTVRC